MKINKETIQQNISQGNTQLAIKMLLSLTKKFDKDIYNSSILLSSRMSSLVKDEKKDIRSSEDLRRNKNRIEYALNSTLEDIDPTWEIEDSTLIPVPIVQDEIRTEKNIGEDVDKSISTILFLASSPQDISQLRLDKEAREIEEGIRRGKQRDAFKFVQKWAVRDSDFTRALLDEKPHIVHFSGHGSSKGRIILEDEIGGSKEIPSEALGRLFALYSKYVNCVILNACYSELQAKEISKYIPYVIGMSQAIEDKAAIKFSTSFYDALASGEDVEFAFEHAKISIGVSGISGENIPVLIRKQTT